MNFFKKKRSFLSGKICDRDSGIYIKLPAKWEAVDMGYHTFMIFTGNKRGTGLTFSVSHLAVPGTAELVNPFTGEKIEQNWVTEGKFESFNTELGNGKFLKIWRTETEKYMIRFMFTYSKKDMESDGEKINQIINSLSVFSTTLS